MALDPQGLMGHSRCREGVVELDLYRLMVYNREYSTIFAPCFAIRGTIRTL